MRAAVAYGDMPRSIAIRLKYGRKVALARSLARYMANLRWEWDEDAVLIPVPLHRWQLWGRGFNQSALVAAVLSKSWGLATAPHLLRRVRRTQPLKGMNHGERKRVVSGAFAVSDRQASAGRTVILMDDVLTTGSTAETCARALRKAGARRVELICWARVVRPARVVR